MESLCYFLLTLLRFRILNAEGLSRDGFDLLLLHRTVVVIRADLRDLVYDVHSVDDLTECRVLTV